MKVLILGGNGMLGHKLVQAWDTKFDVFTTLRGKLSNYEQFGIFKKEKVIDEIDVDNFKAVEKVINEIKPQVIFNAIGIIKQLPSSKNVVKTLNINSIFPNKLSVVAEKFNSRLINISTDCVFSGKKGDYTEEDYPDAQDLYGKSKNFGEVSEGNCLTVRTSIIGRELSIGHSLVEWFLSNRGKTVKGFKNAIYTGFPTIVLAEILADLIQNFPELNGLYHVSSDKINKFELLKLINKEFQANIEIIPDEDFRIDRSLNSEKFRKKTAFKPLEWTKMIKLMAEDAEFYKNFKK